VAHQSGHQPLILLVSHLRFAVVGQYFGQEGSGAAGCVAGEIDAGGMQLGQLQANGFAQTPQRRLGHLGHTAVHRLRLRRYQPEARRSGQLCLGDSLHQLQHTARSGGYGRCQPLHLQRFSLWGI
jgi:hypothetical protein